MISHDLLRLVHFDLDRLLLITDLLFELLHLLVFLVNLLRVGLLQFLLLDDGELFDVLPLLVNLLQLPQFVVQLLLSHLFLTDG